MKNIRNVEIRNRTIGCHKNTEAAYRTYLFFRLILTQSGSLIQKTT